MSDGLHIIVLGSVVPCPLQTLEPTGDLANPAIKNEMMLPMVLDPWAAHALFEAANLASSVEGSNVTLVSMGPKAKLQQLMMTLAQKVAFDLVAVDGPAGGFKDSFETATELAKAVKNIPDLGLDKVLLFGGWESSSRGAGTTLQMVGAMLGIQEQFQGVDVISVEGDGTFRILERIEGGKHQVSTCRGTPAVLGWATGNLPEPPNNPQIGMKNMRTVMPALMKAQAGSVPSQGLSFEAITLPKQLRETKIEKDMTSEEIAQDIVNWIES